MSIGGSELECKDKALSPFVPFDAQAAKSTAAELQSAAVIPNSLAQDSFVSRQHHPSTKHGSKIASMQAVPPPPVAGETEKAKASPENPGTISPNFISEAAKGASGAMGAPSFGQVYLIKPRTRTLLVSASSC